MCVVLPLHALRGLFLNLELLATTNEIDLENNKNHIYNYRLDTSVQLDLPHSMPRMSTSSTMLRVKVHCSITSTSGWAAMPVTLWCTQPMSTVRCWPSVCLEDL